MHAWKGQRILAGAALGAAALLAAGPMAAAAKTPAKVVPHIRTVRTRLVDGTLHLTIMGTGFGDLRRGPFTGDSAYFWLQDLTRGWQAGNARSGNRATVRIAAWSPDAVVVLYNPMTNGRKDTYALAAGDHIELRVANPQDLLGALWRGRIS